MTTQIEIPAVTQEMGAVPHEGGVTFRVWAPSAKSVAVSGTFNGWKKEGQALQPEGDGIWAASVAGAKVGDQYKFIIVSDFADAPLWKNDPYAREVTASNGNSVVADAHFQWTDTTFVCPLMNELVIYELHVGTFLFDPDSPAKRGTFRSLQSKLPYLRELGVNAIEIMAAGEFPMDQSWGYNPSYIFAIESSYGGPNGFRALVDSANQQGIAVILDVVFNHLGPGDLDLWRFDGRDFDGNGGIYFYDRQRAQTPWGETRPNYGSGPVRQFLRDSAARWVESRGADGLRWDATAWIRNVDGRDDGAGDLPDGWSLMMWINDEIHRLAPRDVSIAEDMRENRWLTKPTGAGGAGFDAQWCASFVHAVRDVVKRVDDGERDMSAIAEAIAHRCNDRPFQRVIYTESHDEVANGHARLPEEIWPGRAADRVAQKRSTLAAAVVFTSPGIPMIFQGQELLEDKWFDDARELDWQKLTTHAGIHLLYRDLIGLRRNRAGTTRGLLGEGVNVFHVNQGAEVLAFHRWDAGGPNDDVVVVLNFSNTAYDRYTIGLPREGAWEVRFNSDWRGYSADFDGHDSFTVSTRVRDRDGLRFEADVSIGAYTAIVLSQNA
jgi:1,4-alpha-glucan branching enzyme